MKWFSNIEYRKHKTLIPEGRETNEVNYDHSILLPENFQAAESVGSLGKPRHLEFSGLSTKEQTAAQRAPEMCMASTWDSSWVLSTCAWGGERLYYQLVIWSWMSHLTSSLYNLKMSSLDCMISRSCTKSSLVLHQNATCMQTSWPQTVMHATTGKLWSRKIILIFNLVFTFLLTFFSWSSISAEGQSIPHLEVLSQAECWYWIAGPSLGSLII